MSTAWFKPNFTPKLLKSFPKETLINTKTGDKASISSSSIEIWNTTCIVTNFGKNQASNCSILINPSNPSLLGVRKFPYFPSGGPQPSSPPTKFEHHIMGYVRQWGGVDIKQRMIFPFNVVDGLVHELGGFRLAIHCYLLPNILQNEKCPVGYAVSTPPGGKRLSAEYDHIVHTVPPFYEYHDGDPSEALSKCYKNSLALCEELAVTQQQQGYEGPIRIACPLLGAGGRGFPLETAVTIAAKESLRWRDGRHDDLNGKREMVLAFGIPQLSVASKLINALTLFQNQGENQGI